MASTSLSSLAARQFTLRTMFLYVHIVSVVLCAFLGIGEIIVGVDDSLRVLMTSAVIALASICGLSCAAALEKAVSELPHSKLQVSFKRNRAAIYPLLGILLTLISAIQMIGMLWELFEFRFWWFPVLAITCIFAVAFCHISLLSLARLSPHLRWAFSLGVIAILTVAISLSAILICSFRWNVFSIDWIWRGIAVGLIFVAMMTVVIPILHLVCRNEMRVHRKLTLGEINEEIERLEGRLLELNGLREARLTVT